MDGLTKIERKVSSDKDTSGSSVRTFTPAELKLYNKPHNAHVAYRGKVSLAIATIKLVCNLLMAERDQGLMDLCLGTGGISQGQYSSHEELTLYPDSDDD